MSQRAKDVKIFEWKERDNALGKYVWQFKVTRA